MSTPGKNENRYMLDNPATADGDKVSLNESESDVIMSSQLGHLRYNGRDDAPVIQASSVFSPEMTVKSDTEATGTSGQMIDPRVLIDYDDNGEKAKTGRMQHNVIDTFKRWFNTKKQKIGKDETATRKEIMEEYSKYSRRSLFKSSCWDTLKIELVSVLKVREEATGVDQQAVYEVAYARIMNSKICLRCMRTEESSCPHMEQEELLAMQCLSIAAKIILGKLENPRNEYEINTAQTGKGKVTIQDPKYNQVGKDPVTLKKELSKIMESSQEDDIYNEETFERKIKEEGTQEYFGGNYSDGSSSDDEKENYYRNFPELSLKVHPPNSTLEPPSDNYPNEYWTTPTRNQETAGRRQSLNPNAFNRGKWDRRLSQQNPNRGTPKTPEGTGGKSFSTRENIKLTRDLLFNNTEFEIGDDIEGYIRKMSNLTDDTNLEGKAKSDIMKRLLKAGLSKGALKRLEKYPNSEEAKTTEDVKAIMRKCFRRFRSEEQITYKLSTLRQGNAKIEEFYQNIVELGNILKEVKLNNAIARSQDGPETRARIRMEVESEIYKALSHGMRRDIKLECFRTYQEKATTHSQLFEAAQREEDLLASVEKARYDSEEDDVYYQGIENEREEKPRGKFRKFQETIERDKSCGFCKENGVKREYSKCRKHNWQIYCREKEMNNRNSQDRENRNFNEKPRNEMKPWVPYKKRQQNRNNGERRKVNCYLCERDNIIMKWPCGNPNHKPWKREFQPYNNARNNNFGGNWRNMEKPKCFGCKGDFPCFNDKCAKSREWRGMKDE